jgi:tetratricopeptide (TPR) repeat protein
MKQINLNQPAIFYYQNALRLNPYDLDSYKRLANLQNTEKFFDQAINTCQTGLSYYPEDITLKKLLGYGYYLNKELDTAAIIFNEVIAKGDTSFFSLKYLGLTYFEMQQFEKAADILLQSVDLMDDDPEVLFFLGSAYGRYGEYAKGVMYLNKALKVLEPPPKQVANIFEEFAYLYREMGKYELSVEYLKKAYRNSAKPILSFKMGQIFDLYLDNKKLAIDYYDGYLTMASINDSVQTDIILLNTDEKELKEYVKNRIRQLEEEMFFEDAGE